MTTPSKRGITVNPREIRKQLVNNPTKAQTVTGDVVPGQQPDPAFYSDNEEDDETLDD